MHDRMEQIIGDYRGFFAAQLEDLWDAGFGISPMPVSHLAYRTATWEEYLKTRTALEALAVANVENVWRGRPISKILLKEPLKLDADHETSLIELIPPVHLFDYPMGLEHVGFVVGKGFADFCDIHKHLFSYAQDMGPHCQPHLVVFRSGYTVKFYERSLHDVVVREGRTFDGFYHAPWQEAV
ncbi:VOC family protein [Kordiimonas gwangyangensis]|uniref:VOC family protein n=1 Tax=Kordiimonas gwangyangensis TaxID=288022 RepID=UPI0003A63469|nr:VOC family protein [Kordiimonas gwangyangensis]